MSCGYCLWDLFIFFSFMSHKKKFSLIWLKSLAYKLKNYFFFYYFSKVCSLLYSLVSFVVFFLFKKDRWKIDKKTFYFDRLWSDKWFKKILWNEILVLVFFGQKKPIIKYFIFSNFPDKIINRFDSFFFCLKNPNHLNKN